MTRWKEREASPPLQCLPCCTHLLHSLAKQNKAKAHKYSNGILRDGGRNVINIKYPGAACLLVFMCTDLFTYRLALLPYGGGGGGEKNGNISIRFRDN